MMHTKNLWKSKFPTNEYIFSGRLELDYITEKYNLTFRKNEETGTLIGLYNQASMKNSQTKRPHHN